jgi:hypothetical protein
MPERRTSTRMASSTGARMRLRSRLQRRASIRLLLAQARSNGFDAGRLRADLLAIDAEIRELSQPGSKSPSHSTTEVHHHDSHQEGTNQDTNRRRAAGAGHPERAREAKAALEAAWIADKPTADLRNAHQAALEAVGEARAALEAERRAEAEAARQAEQRAYRADGRGRWSIRC